LVETDGRRDPWVIAADALAVALATLVVYIICTIAWDEHNSILTIIVPVAVPIFRYWVLPGLLFRALGLDRRGRPRKDRQRRRGAGRAEP